MITNNAIARKSGFLQFIRISREPTLGWFSRCGGIRQGSSLTKERKTRPRIQFNTKDGYDWLGGARGEVW
jgi:hypothetical protein